MIKPDIQIRTEQDWALLRQQKISTIVDPMIVRSADLFLQGPPQSRTKADEVWKALSKNIDSIEGFFDAFILSERLPLVDYGITFESNIGFEPQSVYRRINEAAEDRVFLNVHLHGSASAAATESARRALRSRASVPDELVKSVSHELSAYDHQWNPDLGDLGPLSDEEVLLA